MFSLPAASNSLQTLKGLATPQGSSSCTTSSVQVLSMSIQLGMMLGNREHPWASPTGTAYEILPEKFWDNITYVT